MGANSISEPETTEIPKLSSKSQFYLVIALSALILVPCHWHKRIEAGDLPSHVYNAWLAQLIPKGQAPGLYIAKQWNNVLFDVLLLRVSNLIGIAAGQKVAVSLCVLVFFWGAFLLIRTFSTRPPWVLIPCIGMLAYGYSFNMGFMNYYFSVGLACIGLGLMLGRGRIKWAAVLVVAALAYFAHPIGFLWLVGTFLYIKFREKLPGLWKALLPLSTVGIFCSANWYAVMHPALSADWDRAAFYYYNGADQIWLYGDRYFYLACAAAGFGIVCVAIDFFLGRQDTGWRNPFGLPFELYAVTFCGIVILPENLRPAIYSGWVGMLGSRVTTIAAILGLCVLGTLRPRKWQAAGFGICALFFFVFLYQDTALLNRLEANAEELTKNLEPGTRVMITAQSSPDSRITFIGHAIERACIGHCFSYGNYEPSSGQFRVRAKKISWAAISSADLAEDVASGEYELDAVELPMKQIYQCDASDLARLCIRDLKAGEVNGRLSVKFPAD